MILIDYQDSRPIYEQIVDRFRVLILREVLRPDDPMPSVRKLSMELSTNPNTVQRAYAELERQGFIYTVKGRGNFVRGGSSLKEVRFRELRGELEGILQKADESGISRRALLEDLLRDAEKTEKDK
ncbi:MAG: GntR family transcriptional regulator [Clostridium sp.]|nr:GntR family transcriptional regulator [Clostridium sp.]